MRGRERERKNQSKSLLFAVQYREGQKECVVRAENREIDRPPIHVHLSIHLHGRGMDAYVVGCECVLLSIRITDTKVKVNERQRERKFLTPRATKSQKLPLNGGFTLMLALNDTQETEQERKKLYKNIFFSKFARKQVFLI